MLSSYSLADLQVGDEFAEADVHPPHARGIRSVESGVVPVVDRFGAFTGNCRDMNVLGKRVDECRRPRRRQPVEPLPDFLQRAAKPLILDDHVDVERRERIAWRQDRLV